MYCCSILFILCMAPLSVSMHASHYKEGFSHYSLIGVKHLFLKGSFWIPRGLVLLYSSGVQQYVYSSPPWVNIYPLVRKNQSTFRISQIVLHSLLPGRASSTYIRWGNTFIQNSVSQLVGHRTDLTEKNKANANNRTQPSVKSTNWLK